MPKRFLQVAVLALGLLVAGAPAWANARERVLYRYVDERGQTVLIDQLTPAAAARGYDVLRRDGSFVRSVPGRLTEEDRQRLRAEEEAEKMRAEETERLRKWDESLMLRYSTVEDIEEAKQRALSDIRMRIGILKSNLTLLKRRVEQDQARAADAERASGEVPQVLLDSIRTVKWQIGDTEESIAIREKELLDAEASYDREISRFQTLLERYGSRD